MQLGNEIDEAGDPPRLWNVTLERPGTAFTRSIGDHLAEGIGVIAEPELLIREVSERSGGGVRKTIIRSTTKLTLFARRRLRPTTSTLLFAVTGCLSS